MNDSCWYSANWSEGVYVCTLIQMFHICNYVYTLIQMFHIYNSPTPLPINNNDLNRHRNWFINSLMVVHTLYHFQCNRIMCALWSGISGGFLMNIQNIMITNNWEPRDSTNVWEMAPKWLSLWIIITSMLPFHSMVTGETMPLFHSMIYVKSYVNNKGTK